MGGWLADWPSGSVYGAASWLPGQPGPQGLGFAGASILECKSLHNNMSDIVSNCAAAGRLFWPPVAKLAARHLRIMLEKASILVG